MIYWQRHPQGHLKVSSNLIVLILLAVHTRNLQTCTASVALLKKKKKDRTHSLSSSGAFEGSGHMIRLCLHPPLHLSDHLTHGQRVTAVHCGPVFTHTSLWRNMQDRHTHTHTHAHTHTHTHTHACTHTHTHAHKYRSSTCADTTMQQEHVENYEVQ